VFWGLLLQTDPEGPTLIFCAASWRTISNLSVLLKFGKSCDIVFISVKLQNSGYIYLSAVWGNL
jgi:hypothetical protein